MYTSWGKAKQTNKTRKNLDTESRSRIYPDLIVGQGQTPTLGINQEKQKISGCLEYIFWSRDGYRETLQDLQLSTKYRYKGRRLIF